MDQQVVEALVRLAKNRDEMQRLKDEETALWDALTGLRAYETYVHVRDMRKQAETEGLELRAHLRTLATVADRDELPPEVTVIAQRQPIYDPAELREWAVNNMPALLKVDEKAAVKMAMDLDALTLGRMGLPVAIETHDDIRVASDLSKYLDA